MFVASQSQIVSVINHSFWILSGKLAASLVYHCSWCVLKSPRMIVLLSGWRVLEESYDGCRSAS